MRRPIWPIEQIVVPPIFSTRSAISSVVAKYSLALLVQHQMVIAEMRARDVPVEVLSFDVQREHIGEQYVERARNILDRVSFQVSRRGKWAVRNDFGS